ncbi:hypothetical protein H4J38_01300 [Colwellia sp. BRX10-3]|uniref:hypothetical protein n=1 Tax=Colwellia sp. BRX10-3 TaxID=2759844 RepID=UPI0015F3FD09|nr:hypothetical protein [Colwellia sp. BRX10-3]MBA6389408.1 hypothetical protein [Colwellia sp. BRX10-3]
MKHISLTKNTKYSLFFSVLFIFNYFIQQTSLSNFLFHLESLSYLSLLLWAFPRDKNLTALLCIFYFICFHQYGADPYSELLQNYLAGPYKLVILIVFSCLFTKVRVSRLWFVLIFFIPVFHQLLFSSYFRLQYILNDFIYYFSIIPLLILGKNSKINIDIAQVIYYFTLTLPVLCLIAYLLDLGNEIKGSYYFFYGHLFSFLLLFSFLYRVFTKECKSKISFVLTVCNFLIFFQSAQSAHFIILILSLGVSLILTRKFKIMFLSVFFVSFFLSMTMIIPKGSWLALKTGQVVNLVGVLNGGSNISTINSVAIRYYTLIAIIDENSITENLIGRGISTIYHDKNNNFSKLNLHEATFPENEMESKEFHLIHESIVRLFFHLGVFGCMLLIYFSYKLIQLNKTNFWYVNSVLFLILLWMSSIQFMGFITIFIKLLSNKKSN